MRFSLAECVTDLKTENSNTYTPEVTCPAVGMRQECGSGHTTWRHQEFFSSWDCFDECVAPPAQRKTITFLLDSLFVGIWCFYRPSFFLVFVSVRTGGTRKTTISIDLGWYLFKRCSDLLRHHCVTAEQNISGTSVKHWHQIKPFLFEFSYHGKKGSFFVFWTFFSQINI